MTRPTAASATTRGPCSSSTTPSSWGPSPGSCGGARRRGSSSATGDTSEAVTSLFGASVLGSSGPHTRPARALLRVFNRQGGFDNLADTEEALREMLEALFERVDLETIGSIAVFAATKPRPPLPD